MSTLWLRIRAPFAAYRPLQAGVFRGTVPTMTHTAAHGLVLNLAAIESRDAASGETTQVRADVPALEIAIGELAVPEVSGLYQQLHSYPVGNSGKEFSERTHGSKYWIAPARRELLSGLDVIIGVRGDAGIADRARAGLAGAYNRERYGLPFAGDNNLLIDRIDVLAAPIDAAWWTPLRTDEAPRTRSARLTVSIDRRDASRTRSGLFAPSAVREREPPANAWVWTPRDAP